MVGVAGFEPAVSWSRTMRATNCATPRSFYKAIILYSPQDGLSSKFEHILVVVNDVRRENMGRAGRGYTALVLAVFIVAKAVFNIFFPDIQLRETVESFFYRQIDELAVMGESISKDGVAAAVSTFLSEHSTQSLYPVYAEQLISEGA